MSEDVGAPDIDHLMAMHLSAADEDAALHGIAMLIDAAVDFGRADATDRAFALLDDLMARDVREDSRATAHYYRANAWHNRAAQRGMLQSWAWEQPELQEEILELRRAVRHPGFPTLPRFRQWQIETNLGSKLSAVGRTIEAVELWDRVLAKEPRFAKAAGNRGQGLVAYARSIDDEGHVGALFAEAHASLKVATTKGALHEQDSEYVLALYKKDLTDIESWIDVEAVRALTAREFSLGCTAEEIAYRRWCLNERLFINPLNDIGALSIAATDATVLPSVTESSLSHLPPPIFGYFNQMKQEFVSARYTLYDGLNSFGPHFSDNDVKLINTLDYPAYGLATERLRMSFRVAYSVLDKVAFFLNAYAGFNHKNLHRVSFRSVWYEGADPKKGLMPLLAQRPNLPMRGLFWLSKDFYEEEFKKVTDPDAEDLATVRNQIEHRYLQLHDMGSGDDDARSAQPGLRYSLGRADFAAKTLKLFRCTRAALIYLAMSVRCEERLRQVPGASALTMPMPLDNWEDDWKQ